MSSDLWLHVKTSDTGSLLMLSESEWISLHMVDLRVMFDESGRWNPLERECGTCEVCNGYGKDRNQLDEVCVCSDCDGDGSVLLTEDELLKEFCSDMYWDQRKEDMRRYRGWAKSG